MFLPFVDAPTPVSFPELGLTSAGVAHRTYWLQYLREIDLLECLLIHKPFRSPVETLQKPRVLGLLLVG